MNCQEGMELMQRYVDRDLNEEETSCLLEHVGQCPDCASMFERLVRLSRGLEQLPHVVPPFSLVDAIMPELNKIQPEAASAPVSAEPAEPARLMPRSRRSQQRHYRSWIPRISGVVALGVVVGLLLINRPDAELARDSRQEAGSMPEASAAQELMLSSPAADLKTQDQYGNPLPSKEAAEAEPGLLSAPEESAPAAPEPQPSAVPGRSSDAQPDPNRSVDRSSGGMLEMENADKNKGVPPEEETIPPEAADVIPKAQVNPDVTSTAPGLNPPAEEEPPVSIMGTLPGTEEAVSPDGQWRAVLQGGILQLYRMSDNSLVYDQAPDTGMRSDLVWSEDSTSLQYTYTDADGNQTPMELKIQDSGFVEIKR